ncbi:MAG: sugar transferase [Bacteroidota bacterium]|nr:sugar transferase [Bacteroidota bacterium]
MHKTDYHNELPALATTESPVVSENAIITRFVASRRNYLFFKRTLDILASFLFISLVLSWLLPILAIWIKLDSRGPVFFLQKRMGLNRKIFWCLKLRTMVLNDEADERQAEENDSRITRAGRILRKTNMDELPQFFNVLTGDMSLIGPRPHMLADCMRFSFVVSSYNFRTFVKPGITGLAQVKGYRGPTKDYESIVKRYYWDAVYVRKAGLWLDIKIIAQTIIRCFRNLLKIISGLFTKKKSIG